MSPPTDAGRNDDVIDLDEYDEAVRTQVPESVDDLKKWFKPAVREIRNLILKDSWLRFQRSPYFAEVSQTQA
jgi:hypothetical protein